MTAVCKRGRNHTVRPTDRFKDMRMDIRPSEYDAAIKYVRRPGQSIIVYSERYDGQFDSYIDVQTFVNGLTNRLPSGASQAQSCNDGECHLAQNRARARTLGWTSSRERRGPEIGRGPQSRRPRSPWSSCLVQFWSRSRRHSAVRQRMYDDHASQTSQPRHQSCRRPVNRLAPCVRKHAVVGVH